jgi:ParB-like nuclease domain
MATEETLLPLDEVTARVRILGQHYVGVRPIRVAHIIGSVDRTVDFDRLFRPRHRTLRNRLRALRRVFPHGMFPPIEVYEVGGMYFVVDGHHRVALAHELGMVYVDAEVTTIRTSQALTPDVDLRQLIHSEQHRIFKERSGLKVRHPEAKLVLSRPTSYAQLLDLVQAHAYEMSLRAGELVPLVDATADWYETEYLPACAAVHEAELPEAYRHKTKADLYLWVQGKRRELRTTNRNATWADAALAARQAGVPRRQQPALMRMMERIRRT